MISSQFTKGFRAGFPIVLGYVPLGLAFGLAASQIGMTPFMVGCMSTISYSGAAQFIAVAMLGVGSSPLSVVTTGLVVNLRHILMSASVAPFLSGWKRWQQVWFGYIMTDESYAVAFSHFLVEPAHPAYGITLAQSAQCSWIVSSVIGACLGEVIENPQAWGLDYALAGMFIGLIVPMAFKREGFVAALCGGLFSVGLFLLGMSGSAVILGAMLGAAVGTAFARRS